MLRIYYLSNKVNLSVEYTYRPLDNHNHSTINTFMFYGINSVASTL